jgi:hypothetical protein
VSLVNARLTNCETRKLDNISHFSLLASLVVSLIFSREASLIFYKILARKIAIRDSLSTLVCGSSLVVVWAGSMVRDVMAEI